VQDVVEEVDEAMAATLRGQTLKELSLAMPAPSESERVL